MRSSFLVNAMPFNQMTLLARGGNGMRWQVWLCLAMLGVTVGGILSMLGRRPRRWFVIGQLIVLGVMCLMFGACFYSI